MPGDKPRWADGAHLTAPLVFLAEWVLPVVAPPLRRGAVAVSGATIAAVGPAAEVKAMYPGATVVDLGPSLLLPGLINCHAHLEYTLFKGLFDGLPFGPWLSGLVAASRRLSREELFLSALWGAAECLRAGITCVGDTTPSGVSFDALGQVGLRGVVYQELFGTGGEKAEAKVERALARMATWPAAQYPKLRLGLAPHAPYTAGTEVLRVAALAAAEHDLPLCLHLAEAVEEMTLQPPGGMVLNPEERKQGPVSYVASLGFLSPRVLAVHCVQVDASDLEVLARKGVRVAHCPRSNARLGHGRAPLELMKKAGLVVGLGTDSAVSGGNLDILEEVRAAIWLHRAFGHSSSFLTAEEAVRLATLGGARALGLEEEIGSIEVGKQADLVAFELAGLRVGAAVDPYTCLAYHLGPQEVKMVMVGGELLLWEGKLLTVDEEMLQREGRSFAATWVRSTEVSIARS